MMPDHDLFDANMRLRDERRSLKARLSAMQADWIAFQKSADAIADQLVIETRLREAAELQARASMSWFVRALICVECREKRRAMLESTYGDSMPENGIEALIAVEFAAARGENIDNEVLAHAALAEVALQKLKSLIEESR